MARPRPPVPRRDDPSADPRTDRPAGPLAGQPPGGAQPAAPDPVDVEAVALQLRRPPRGMRLVAHRCPCGLPDVVQTAPRLPDGTPFPTLYYLTCVRASAAASRLEAAGLMREMTARLGTEPELRAAYERANDDYRARRSVAADAAGVTPLPPSAATAGGMPDRVKCLHALAAHELAVPGINPLGREALRAMGKWWEAGPCVKVPERPPAPGAGTAVPAATWTPEDGGNGR